MGLGPCLTCVVKIAYVAEEVHKQAGVPRCVAELIERIAPGNELFVLSRTLEGISRENIRCYRIPTLGALFPRAITFRFVANLVLAYLIYIRRKRFDIVHSTGFDGGLFSNVVTFHFCTREGLTVEKQELRRLRPPWYRFPSRLSHFLSRYLTV